MSSRAASFPQAWHRTKSVSAPCCGVVHGLTWWVWIGLVGFDHVCVCVCVKCTYTTRISTHAIHTNQEESFTCLVEGVDQVGVLGPRQHPLQRVEQHAAQLLLPPWSLIGLWLVVGLFCVVRDACVLGGGGG